MLPTSPSPSTNERRKFFELTQVYLTGATKTSSSASLRASACASTLDRTSPPYTQKITVYKFSLWCRFVYLIVCLSSFDIIFCSLRFSARINTRVQFQCSCTILMRFASYPTLHATSTMLTRERVEQFIDLVSANEENFNTPSLLSPCSSFSPFLYFFASLFPPLGSDLQAEMQSIFLVMYLNICSALPHVRLSDENGV